MRRVLVGIAATGLVLAAWLAARPSGAQGQALLYISGMEIKGDKPIALVRLTNTSPDAGDTFSVHYTIRDTTAGIPLSEPGAGIGAQLIGRQTLQLDLGKIVTAYRAARGAVPYTGNVQFIAFGEGGVNRTFGPDTIHVEAKQIDGAVIRDAVVHWTEE